MNAESELPRRDASAGLPDWAECDLFCIRGYADAAGASCGWRGRLEDARRISIGPNLSCPWCGNASLLRIPPNRADRS